MVWFPTQDIGNINYFCLTPFSILHLKETKWYFGNVFSAFLEVDSNIIIVHMITKLELQLSMRYLLSAVG